MYKKVLTLMFASSLLLGACGNDSDPAEKSAADSTEEVAEEKETEEEIASSLPTEEIGEGDFYIVNQSGSSEDTEIVEFYNEELLTPSLSYEGWDMDGSYKTFIYVNDVLTAEEQIADAQSSFDIPMSEYEIGENTVTAVQYEDNTEDGEPVFVRTIDFTIE